MDIDIQLALLNCIDSLNRNNEELTRPFNILKPPMAATAEGFEIIFANNCITGKTPDETARNFDVFWHSGK